MVVGVNRYVEDQEVDVSLQRIDDEAVRRQIDRVQAHKDAQNRVLVESALGEVAATATSDGNLLLPMREALRTGATLGQIGASLRTIFGEYRAPQ